MKPGASQGSSELGHFLGPSRPLPGPQEARFCLHAMGWWCPDWTELGGPPAFSTLCPWCLNSLSGRHSLHCGLENTLTEKSAS